VLLITTIITTICIMNVVRCSHAYSNTYLLMEDDDVEAALNKNLLKMTIMGPFEDFDSKRDQQQEEAFLCTCFINIPKATVAINAFAIMTNIFTLIILSLAMSTTGFGNLKSLFHGELTGLEMRELGSVLATSIAITIMSIVSGMFALVGIIKCNIWLIVPNLVWLVVGYILTVAINLKATAAVTNYNYGLENIMFHFVVTCCFFIPNIVFLKDELSRKPCLVTTKQTGQ
jgi:hypothetical protein